MAFIYCVYFITQNAALKSCIFKCFYKNKWHPVISAFFWKHLVTWCSTTIGDWPQPWWSGYPSYCMQCSVMNHGDIRKSYCVMANTPLEIVSGVVVFDPIWRPSPVSVRAMSVIVIQPGHLLKCLHTLHRCSREPSGVECQLGSPPAQRVMPQQVNCLPAWDFMTSRVTRWWS